MFLISSGPVLTLVLSKRGEEAGYGLIPEIRDLIGPTDVNLAKEEAPERYCMISFWRFQFHILNLTYIVHLGIQIEVISC